MAIFTYDNEQATVAQCDSCGETTSTVAATGVVPEGWGTGRLWIDISLSEQKNFPICFCPNCVGGIKLSSLFNVSAKVE